MMPSTRTLFIAAVLLFLLSAAVAVTQPVSVEMARYPITADVTNNLQDLELGVSIDADRIDFGRLPAREMTAEKSVTVTNNDGQLMRVRAYATGNITDYMRVSPETVTIPEGATQDINMELETTNKTVPGRYEGVLVVEEQTPFWRWLWKNN